MSTLDELKAKLEEAKDELLGLQDEYDTGAFYNWQHWRTWGEPPEEHFRSRDELNELISEKENEIEKLEDEIADLEEKIEEYEDTTE